MARYRTPFIGRPFDQVVTHNQFNDQARAVENTQAISVTPPLTIENTLTGGQRLGINLPPPAMAAIAAPAIMVKQFRIKFTSPVESDVLKCRTFLDDVEGDEDIWVAKPWFLRGSNTWTADRSRGNITYSGYNINQSERTATKGVGDDVETERQKLVPSYFVGDRILAIRVDAGLTQPESDPPESVLWADLNVDGRMWAKV